jgi:hypothetical protein
MNMDSHACAQDVEAEVLDEIAEMRTKKRRTTQKLDLTNPAALNKEVVFALARRIHPDTVAAKIEEMMNMKRQTKAGEVPDVRAMEAGVKLYLSYTVGMPTQRQEIFSVLLDADNAGALRDRLRSSPAMRQTLAGLLQEVEGETPVEK